MLSHRVLEGVEPGTNESDYALLNLVTLYFQTTKWQQSRDFARRLLELTSSDQLRLIADGTGLLIDANDSGSIEALSRRLAALAEKPARGASPLLWRNECST